MKESWDKDAPSIKFQQHYWKAYERVEVIAIPCFCDGKLSLKADEPKVDQQHEDVEEKTDMLPHYYFL